MSRRASQGGALQAAGLAAWLRVYASAVELALGNLQKTSPGEQPPLANKLHNSERPTLFFRRSITASVPSPDTDSSACLSAYTLRSAT